MRVFAVCDDFGCHIISCWLLVPSVLSSLKSKQLSTRSLYRTSCFHLLTSFTETPAVVPKKPHKYLDQILAQKAGQDIGNNKQICDRINSVQPCAVLCLLLHMTASSRANIQWRKLKAETQQCLDCNWTNSFYLYVSRCFVE